MFTKKSQAIRIHFTNMKEYVTLRDGHKHYICYCGKSYSTFGGGYAHSVWTLDILTASRTSPVFQIIAGVVCPECYNSPDLALDTLARIDNG